MTMEEGSGAPVPWQMNFQTPVTEIARQIDGLHVWMLIICLVIFVLVFGVMFYSILKHRKSVGHSSAHFHESVAVEIAWTVVPFIIVIAMAIPATKTVVAMKDTSNADITIKATGIQWKWGYDYLAGEGSGIGFLSTLATPYEQVIDSSQKKDDFYLLAVDRPLVVPINKKIRMVTTASDVIHSWAVPALGVKQDAIPGFVRDTWFKVDKLGTYRGQCVELCGRGHAFMPIVVKVVSNENYTQWVAQQRAAMAKEAEDPNKIWTVGELVQRGETVYASNCTMCHQANGKGIPGAFPALDGALTVNGPKAEQIHLVLEGKINGNSVMPPWKDTLSDTDIAAVITYTRNTWSNKVLSPDNIIQPAEVLAARQK